jgi:precorrin-8X/cobalt-precorrin-8 methylmutase
MPVFDAYLMVDWSASNKPKTGPDSIWYCLSVREAGTLITKEPRNPKTRRQAIEEIKSLLIQLFAGGFITLVGFDFPYSFPAGLAERLGLNVLPPWRAVWDMLSSRITDGPDNRNNRFQVASGLNERISRSACPFWACPASATTEFLRPTKQRMDSGHGLAEHRLTDARISGPQSPWKLYTAGSVGSQSLVGIPCVRSLRLDPDLCDISRVWPFETGFRAPRRPDPSDWRILHAEIYPSIWSVAVPDKEVKDQAQVRKLAMTFGALDEIEELSPMFDCPPDLSRPDIDKVEREEGWILGVR